MVKKSKMPECMYGWVRGTDELLDNTESYKKDNKECREELGRQNNTVFIDRSIEIQ